MNHRNLFISLGIVYLLFGLPLLPFPASIVEMYAVTWNGLDAMAEVLARAHGALLIALAVGLFAATKARASYGRRAILLFIVVASLLVGTAHVISILDGVENSMGWGTVALSVIFLVWGAKLLREEKELEPA